MNVKTYLIRCKKENLIWLFWIVLNSLCVFLNGMFSAKAITSLVSFEIGEFIINCCVIFFVNILWVIQIYQGSKTKEKAIQKMCNEIRKDISVKLEAAGIMNFEQRNKSTYLSWMTNDIHTISDLGFETLELMVMQGLNILFAIIAFLSFHFSLLFTVALFFILMVNLPKLFTKKMELKAQTFSEKNEELVQSIDDVLSGYRNLENSNKVSYMTQKIIVFGTNYMNARIDYSKTLGGLMATQNGTSFISQIVILMHSGVLYLFKLIPIGGVSSSQYFASIIFAGLTGFTANYAEFTSINKIFDKYKNMEKEWEILPLSDLNAKSLNLKGEIILDQIQLSRGDQTVFKDLNLTFEANKKYALIGKSGIGKSSILKLINQELMPDNGKILLDRMDTKFMSAFLVHDNIGYISQEDHIFNESLLFNLTLGKNFPVGEIEAVLEKLDLIDWVRKLPHGLESKLSQLNQDISNGQKQRILLARLFLENKKIWLIDEGTSAIDPQHRSYLEEHILSQKNKTIIFVTHHLEENSSDMFDEIIELDRFV